jgi:Lrp/AsnC family transcriptional regulator for asnA, asnC and gidA
MTHSSTICERTTGTVTKRQQGELNSSAERGGMDALDRTILAVLQEDARLPNHEIARRVSSSEPTVRRRIQRLIDQGVMRVVAVVSPFELGYQVVAILGLRIDRNHVRAVGEAIAAMPEVRFAGVTLGTYDIMAEVWLESVESLLDFIPERLSGQPGVNHVEPIQIVRLLKYSYDWGVQPSAALRPMSPARRPSTPLSSSATPTGPEDSPIATSG